MIEFDGVVYEVYDIDSIETQRYDDKVYNIEVERDHSYIVENYVVKNCESWSYWAWYHQAYQNDYSYIDDNIPDLDKRLQAPKVNNVRLQGALCKHLYSVLEYITRPFVLLAISDDINKYLKGEEDKYHQQTTATQNWYDAVKQWTSEDATEYLGMTKEQILADLSKTIKIDSEIDLDEYVDDLVKDAMKKNKNNPDPKLERQIADKVKEELDLEDEYNKMKPEEVDTDEENIE